MILMGGLLGSYSGCSARQTLYSCRSTPPTTRSATPPTSIEALIVRPTGRQLDDGVGRPESAEPSSWPTDCSAQMIAVDRSTRSEPPAREPPTTRNGSPVAGCGSLAALASGSSSGNVVLGGRAGAARGGDGDGATSAD